MALSGILEHLDSSPGNALLSQGVSNIGVLRFAIWPQILPRLMDVTLYRCEHNLRAPIVLLREESEGSKQKNRQGRSF